MKIKTGALRAGQWGVKCFFCVVLIILSAKLVFAQTVKSQTPGFQLQKQSTHTRTPFKVIGYLRVADLENAHFSFLDSPYVTQVNIAFINPNEKGIIGAVPGLSSFVKRAHKSGVLVFASIGGGHRHAYFDTLLNSKNRHQIYQQLTALISNYQLDGIDVDIENEDITENYAPFVIGLGKVVHRLDKQLSAALSYATRNKISDKVLNTYDFINLMAYDKTGPWRPDSPGQHAPYDMCVTQLDYWQNDRSVPLDKEVLGLPFYGYGFGKDTAFGLSYKQILERYLMPDNGAGVSTQIGTGADSVNHITLSSGIDIYYNGPKLIIKKVRLAQKRAAGIMIWHLMQDAEGDYSLLKAIHSAISRH